MSTIYESMVSALREHWKTNNNAYPQRFELLQVTLDALVKERTLVTETMNFKERTALGEDFLGVPLVASQDGNAMVAVDGSRIPLDS